MEKNLKKPAEVLVVDEKVPTIRPLGPNSGNPPGAADVLFQLITSKLILQVLLATMTVLSLIGFCLVKIKGTLPRDPCGIGSTMALLAGSQICAQGSGIIPEAGQQMSESQLRRIFDGWVFSLGWWSSGSSVAPSLAPEDIQGSDTVRKLVSGTVITEMPGEQLFDVDVGKANG
ncbi:uncharacterized protein FTOL_00117 [Fusarium torulosum]|uniref:Uncharacterized protein n=1 Tax=Fusarium torulosum TaxID=33205 RepID=A0AAE8LXT2_9HYPO|nr:uncharacterized protein FTOL_00117 [Fusarium torulosum]